MSPFHIVLEALLYTVLVAGFPYRMEERRKLIGSTHLKQADEHQGHL